MRTVAPGVTMIVTQWLSAWSSFKRRLLLRARQMHGQHDHHANHAKSRRNASHGEQASQMARVMCDAAFSVGRKAVNLERRRSRRSCYRKVVSGDVPSVRGTPT